MIEPLGLNLVVLIVFPLHQRKTHSESNSSSQCDGALPNSNLPIVSVPQLLTLWSYVYRASTISCHVPIFSTAVSTPVLGCRKEWSDVPCIARSLPYAAVQGPRVVQRRTQATAVRNSRLLCRNSNLSSELIAQLKILISGDPIPIPQKLGNPPTASTERNSSFGHPRYVL
ncbi:hypothetical protein H4582DRAFT_1126836 [Lactarius indigo]|nr:hypothetical protein H4582DRAFT_1126836 [Lactarius indigo]